MLPAQTTPQSPVHKTPGFTMEYVKDNRFNHKGYYTKE